MTTMPTLGWLLQQTSLALEPLVERLADPEDALELLRELGVELDEAPQELLDLVTPVDALITAVGDIESAVQESDVVSLLTSIVSALTAAKDAVDAVADLGPALENLVTSSDFTPGELAEVGRRLFDKLLIEYIDQASPVLLGILVLFDLVEVSFLEDTGEAKVAHVEATWHLDRLGDWLSDPLGQFASVFQIDGPDFDVMNIIRPALQLGRIMGVRAELEYGAGGMLGLSLPIYRASTPTGPQGLGLDLLYLPPYEDKGGGVGLSPRVLGGITPTQSLGGDLSLSLTGDLLDDGAVLAFRPPASVLFEERSGADTSVGSFGVILAWTPPEPFVLLAHPNLFELSVQGLSIGMNASGSSGTVRPSVTLGLVGGKMALLPTDADGFVQSAIPLDLSVTFDLDVTVTPDGVTVDADTGLVIDLPAPSSPFPFLSIDALRIEIMTEGDGLKVSAVGDFGFDIGPVAATITGIGAGVTFSLPDDGRGNLGLVQVDSPRFVPPKGLGLVIDTGVVVGGGFLYLDPDRGEYAGVVQIEAIGIGISAAGILLTNFDGQGNWSLILSISVTFTAVQLGFGFTLDGVGGIFGVHRTMAIDVLQAGVRDGSLESILYPEDAIGNATTLIATLGSAFPPMLDQFVFGPSIRIGWAAILRGEIGVLIELPDPIVIVLIGQLDLGLPLLAVPVVEFHLDVLGVIDIPGGYVAIDASLRDSHIAGIAVTGDAAMRAHWLGEPSFTLSIGGFNPAYPAPPDLPNLRRVAIGLDTGGNPLISLGGYLAITSNSFQIGAHFDFFMDAGPFTIEAWSGFDVLFIFEPFQLEAGMGIGATVSAGGITLLGVDLSVTVKGPKPWSVRGVAEFEIVGLKHDFEVDVTIGDPELPEEIPTVVASDLLLAALADAQNWNATLPEEEPAGVSFAAIQATDELLLHPAGRLEVRQTVVPFGEEIDLVGTAEVEGGNRFAILAVEVDDGTGQFSDLPDDAWEGLDEWFAPGQYFELTPEEKLGGPAFELMQAGVSIAGGSMVAGGLVDAPFGYEQVIVDPDVEAAGYPAPPPLGTYTSSEETQLMFAELSGAEGRIRPKPTPWVEVIEPTFVAATKDDLSEVELTGATSRSRAGLLRTIRRTGQTDALQVVPSHEART